MSTEHPIDPALLDQAQAGTGGRGTKRKARGSVSVVEPGTGVGNTRSSTRLAVKTSSAGVGLVAEGQGQTQGQKTAGEPSRGEEENLIGSEYKLRGKRPRGGKAKSKSASKSPVKKRTSLPSNDQSKGKGKEKEEVKEKDQAGLGGLEESAPIVSHPPIPLLYRPPYPIMTRPFIYPCLRPGQVYPPLDSSGKIWKRYDPHEFDDPQSLHDTDSLSSDEEDHVDEAQNKRGKEDRTDNVQSAGQEIGPGGGEGGYTDGPFGVGMGGELEYDTQAYQSLAALLEASNDDLFHEGGQ